MVEEGPSKPRFGLRNLGNGGSANSPGGSRGVREADLVFDNGGSRALVATPGSAGEVVSEVVDHLGDDLRAFVCWMFLIGGDQPGINGIIQAV